MSADAQTPYSIHSVTLHPRIAYRIWMIFSSLHSGAAASSPATRKLLILKGRRRDIIHLIVSVEFTSCFRLFRRSRLITATRLSETANFACRGTTCAKFGDKGWRSRAADHSV